VKRYEQLMRAAHSFRRLAKKQPHLRAQHMKMARLGMKRAASAGDLPAMTPDEISGKYLNDNQPNPEPKESLNSSSPEPNVTAQGSPSEEPPNPSSLA
jgi:hypothetical protein